MEKLRESTLEAKLKQQLYSKLQTYLKLLRLYEETHGQMGRLILEKEIKNLEADGRGRSDAIAELARVKGLESPPPQEELPIKPNTKTTDRSTVAVVEMGPEEEEIPKPQKDADEEIKVISPAKLTSSVGLASRIRDALAAKGISPAKVTSPVEAVSPTKKGTLTPPRKAEVVEKSRRESISVARPRPTELPILAALSATSGVVTLAAGWFLSLIPERGLPLSELFMNPGALIPAGGADSFVPLLELLSLVFCAAFFVAVGFLAMGKKWAWNLMFVSTAAWMAIIALTATFISGSSMFVNLAVVMLILSAVSFYLMTSDSVKDFFKT